MGVQEINNNLEPLPDNTQDEIDPVLDQQIQEAAAQMSNNLLGVMSPLDVNSTSYEDLQQNLLRQSQENQEALESLDMIEKLPIYDESNLSSLTQLSDHLSQTFKQVDQLEKVIDFMEKKADALDKRMASLDQEQQNWINHHNSSSN